MKRDNVIFDIIDRERQRQLKGIELIASENFVSDQVMEAMGSCLTNKYAERRRQGTQWEQRQERNEYLNWSRSINQTILRSGCDT